MTREELIKNIKYTIQKHQNDKVNTFDTDIVLMCKDILDYLESEEEIEHDILRAYDVGAKEVLENAKKKIIEIKEIKHGVLPWSLDKITEMIAKGEILGLETALLIINKYIADIER